MSARRCSTPSTSSSPTGARSNCAARVSTSPPTCWSASSPAANACARRSCILGWLCGAGAVARGAARRRQPGAAARVRAAAGRRDGRLAAAPRAAVGARAVRRVASRPRAVRVARTRFGESAAVLLGDLCLVWAEQMLRDSGVDPAALAAGLAPIRRDAHRTGGRPIRRSGERCRRPAYAGAVLEVARRKSGNYTVRRPLEIGAAMAGCGDRTAGPARRLRRGGRRSVPAARRPARHLRLADGHRQARAAPT